MHTITDPYKSTRLVTIVITYYINIMKYIIKFIDIQYGRLFVSFWVGNYVWHTHATHIAKYFIVHVYKYMLELLSHVYTRKAAK